MGHNHGERSFYSLSASEDVSDESAIPEISASKIEESALYTIGESP